MRKSLIIIGTLLLAILPVEAQNRTVFGGQRNAFDYAYGINKSVSALVVDNANPTPTGTATITVAFGNTTAGDGTVFAPLSTLAYVTVGSGSDLETVLPSAVSCGTPVIYDSCTFTASFIYTHGRGEPITSGTYGLSEAVDIQTGIGLATPLPPGIYGGIVTLDSSWYLYGGTQALIQTKITPFSDVYILDNSGTPGLRYFVLTPASQTTSSAGAAPTGTLTAGGALSAGAYYFKYAYVDAQGQISQASSEVASSLTATSTNASFTVAAPAAANGQVGYVMYVTAAAGGSGNEYFYPLTSSNCVLTTVETIVPACALTNATYNQTGVTALINSNPSTSQAKVIGAVDSINRTAFYYAPSNSFGAVSPIPITVMSQPATATAAATYNVAALAINGGLFSQVGREYKICGSGHFTYATTGTQLQFALYEGPYNNSDVALATTNAATSTATSGNAVAQFCFNVDITASSTTATALVHGYNMVNTAALSAGATAFTDSNVAAIASLPNSGVQFLRLAVINAAAYGSGGFVLDTYSILALH